MPELIEITAAPTVIDVLVTPQVIELLTNTDPNVVVALASGITIASAIGNNDPAIGSILTFPVATGVALSTGKVCQVVDGELTLATIEDSNCAYGTIGIYDAATGFVIVSGRISLAGWNWTVGLPLFLGKNGNLVHIPLVDSLFYLQVATVVTPTQIQIDIKQPVYL